MWEINKEIYKTLPLRKKVAAKIGVLLANLGILK